VAQSRDHVPGVVGERDGWLGSSASLEQGTALDLRAVCLLREISAQSSAIADVAFSEPWLGALPLILGASAELKRKYLPGYLAGSLLPAFALSEPDAGSDVQAITTSVRREGSWFVINGRKTWTSNCGLADLYIVFARLEGEPGRNEIAAIASVTHPKQHIELSTPFRFSVEWGQERRSRRTALSPRSCVPNL
jgi:acyl-CoA dehydrogenase